METATQTLHRLTSMSQFEEARAWDPPVDDPRVVRDLVVNDVEHLPWFYKRYPHPLPRLQLPDQLPGTTAAAVDVLAGTATVARAQLSLSQLSRLLHLSAGVVRVTQRPYGPYLFRAAGSAGGRFPLEVYLAAPADGLVAAGVYWYHPQDHCLVLVGPPPSGDAPALVITGIPWRTGWRYRERGFRHVYWDAGTMLSQLLAAADSAGIAARLHTRFGDEAVAALVGADRVHEWPVAIVTLGTAHQRWPQPARQVPARWTTRRLSSRSSRPRSGPVTRPRSARPGTAARRLTFHRTRVLRWTLSSWRAGRNGS